MISEEQLSKVQARTKIQQITETVKAVLDSDVKNIWDFSGKEGRDPLFGQLSHLMWLIQGSMMTGLKI